MLLHFYALGLILLALLPAGMMKSNLQLFLRLPTVSKKQRHSDSSGNSVTVLIPARNEEAGIAECLESVLASKWSPLEVIVMDDSSTDRTLEICQGIAKRDARLQVLEGRELPMGWNGKQRACWKMALAASGDWLLFLDADVRLSNDAIARLVYAAQSGEIDLLSGFPKQVTGTVLEKFLIPLMHFLLLGYLPLNRMRASARPEYAAGCGQLFFARRTAYMTCEGHKAISSSRHDGIKLPRAFRKQHFKTDVFDATDLASCRMYHSAWQVVRGLLKNATEGIAHPKTIWIFTILLAGASILPLASLTVGWFLGWDKWILIELSIATLLSYIPRAIAAIRFKQSWLGVLFHPIAVLLFLGLQWLALLASFCGVQFAWRGRS